MAGVYLNLASQNPFTFGGDITGDPNNGKAGSDAVLGVKYAFSVTNTGGVWTAVADGVAGVLLEAGGSVSNLGTITDTATTGKGIGVLMLTGGNVTNGSSSAHTAVISGGSIGVDIEVSGFLLTNYATITSTGYAAVARAGSNITNAAAGFISGYTDGIFLGPPGSASGAGTVINSGTVEATGTARGNGIVLNVTTAAFVDNSGTVTGKGGYKAGAGLGVALNYGGVLKNEKNGVIQGFAAGVSTDQKTATVTNYGEISGAATRSGIGYAGVRLKAGGTVVNKSGGLINGGGYNDGVALLGAGGTVSNLGTIRSNYNGVFLDSGGSVLNNSSGTANGYILGQIGVLINGSAGTVANFGTINTANGRTIGVLLSRGGTVTNYAGARISGDRGVVFSGLPGNLNNYGTILSNYNNAPGVGVRLNGGGTINNATSTSAITAKNDGIELNGSMSASIIKFGAISGALGIKGDSGTNAANTIRNIGTIVGSGGTAIAFGGGDDRLIEFPQAVITGTASGGGGNNTLELWATGQTGTLTGLGSSFTSFGTVEVDGNGDWLFAATNATASDTIKLDDQAVAEFQGTVGSGQTLAFTTGSGTLNLDNAGQFAGTISGFTGANDVVDLASLSFTGTTQTSFDIAHNALTVTEGAASVKLQLGAADYTGVAWVAKDDGNGGTGVTATAVCFCRGTRIATERGEVPVEELAVGDRVETLSGAFKPIVWIGIGRDLVTRKHSLARPIIVRRGALADNVPRRDLYLTHGHALYVGGVLIPVENLVNHRTIVWDEAAQVVEYYHIELEDHEVVFAEGASAESYYDAQNRARFHNTRAGSEAGANKPTFAPVLNAGDVVEKIWDELNERAGGCADGDTTDDPDLHLVVDGERLDPVSREDGVYTFALDGQTAGRLILRSRSAVPSLLGLSRNEHRRLGVAIKQLILHRPGVMTCLDDDGPLFTEGGCHVSEKGYCWTDGEFDLPAVTFAHLRGAFTSCTPRDRACDTRSPPGLHKLLERCNIKAGPGKGQPAPKQSGLYPRQRPVQPTTFMLQDNGRAFPPNYLHESWRDYLYWDTELDPS